MTSEVASLVPREQHGHILKTIIDNPAERDAFGPEMMQEPSAAVAYLGCREDLWVGVICGEGSQFTAGLDAPKVFGPATTARPHLHRSWRPRHRFTYPRAIYPQASARQPGRQGRGPSPSWRAAPPSPEAADHRPPPPSDRRPPVRGRMEAPQDARAWRDDRLDFVREAISLAQETAQ